MNIFAFGTNNVDHIVAASELGSWAVSPGKDQHNKSLAGKAKNMREGDYVVFCATKKASKQGIVAVGRVRSTPRIGENGEVETITYSRWGNKEYCLPFGVEFFHAVNVDNIMSPDTMKALGISYRDLNNVSATCDFAPSKLSGDQFLAIWQYLEYGYL